MSATNPFDALLREASPLPNSQISGIAELKAILGVSSDEIDLFQRLGLISAVDPNDGELPSSADIERMKIVVWAKSCLFSISEISAILNIHDNNQRIEEFISVISKQIVELDFQIREREVIVSHLREIREFVI